MHISCPNSSTLFSLRTSLVRLLPSLKLRQLKLRQEQNCLASTVTVVAPPDGELGSRSILVTKKYSFSSALFSLYNRASGKETISKKDQERRVKGTSQISILRLLSYSLSPSHVVQLYTGNDFALLPTITILTRV